MSNKQLYYIRLIQTRSSANLNCTNDRITFNTSALCLGRYDPIQTAMTFANQTYPYTRKENSKEIFGIFQSYDNSGFIEDVPIQDYTQFYTKMNELIANNWIDSNTMSIIVISNLYNINLDLIMIVRLLYENLNNKFHYTKDFQIFDKSMQQQGSMWISLVFSLVCIILMIRTLRNEVQKEIPYLIMNHRNRWEKFIYQTKIWIKNTKLNYRLPDIFEAISFCNFAFYFSLIAIRMSYLKETSSLNIYVTRFTDLEKSSQTYELVTYLNCLSILVFMLSVINHINYLSDDFKQITDAIKKVTMSIVII